MATVSRPSRPWLRGLAQEKSSPAEGLLWLLVLAAVTAGFAIVRGHIDKVYPTLGYLLVVLAASSRLGRRWGLAIAILAFLCFDFFLLPPYHTLVLGDPFDWVVLGCFLITGGVAAQLFEIARHETRAARARAEEIDRFSQVGAEALSAGRAEDGVEALAHLIRDTTQVRRCEVYLYGPGGERVQPVAAWPGAPEGLLSSDGSDLLDYATRYRAVAVQRPTGDVHVEAAEGDLSRVLAELPSAVAVLIPLVVRERTTGLLRLEGRGNRLTDAEIRFVEALAYYTALGVERVRLVAEEERADALREANRLKDALLAAVSHDLRTPLTTIKAVAQELRPREQAAAVIEAEADRLNRFVADLLDVSRLDSDSRPLQPEIVPADDLVSAALPQLSAEATGRDIRAKMVEEPVPSGRMDFVLALRSLLNLIENACKHAPSGPIDITVRRDGPELVFAVADRGPGVPEDERDRIFEPFFHSQRAPNGDGTGLGLSIARRLARVQGGDVRYQPRPGGGSVFELVLPAADAPLQNIATVEEDADD